MGKDAHQEETVGSRSASLHISTNGNNSAGGRQSITVAVTLAQGTKRPGEAFAVEEEGIFETGVGNFDLRYGKTACESVCLI